MKARVSVQTTSHSKEIVFDAADYQTVLNAIAQWRVNEWRIKKINYRVMAVNIIK